MLINIIILIIGILMCFLGFKLFRIWLAAAGLILGAQIGYYLGGLIGGNPWPIVGAVLIALLLAVFAYFLFKVGAGIIGALLGASLTVSLFEAFGAQPVWWVTLIGAVVVGVLAVAFLKGFIIAASAFFGAYLTVGGANALITGQQFFMAHDNYVVFNINLAWYLLAAIIVLAVIAISVQLRYKKPEALS